MVVSELIQSAQKVLFLTKNINKSVKIRRNSLRNWSKNTFLVKATYSQCAGNQSEHTNGSGMKFLIFWDPRTAIKGKIGGFRIKSPHREQILLSFWNLKITKSVQFLPLFLWYFMFGIKFLIFWEKRINSGPIFYMSKIFLGKITTQYLSLYS